MAAREDLSVCVPMCSRLASGYKLACLVESAGRRGGANACEDGLGLEASFAREDHTIYPDKMKRVTTTRSALRPGA